MDRITLTRPCFPHLFTCLRLLLLFAAVLLAMTVFAGTCALAVAQPAAGEAENTVAVLWQALLAARLAANPSFILVEREEIDAALNELQLTRGLAPDAGDLRLGAFTGVDYLVLGRLSADGAQYRFDGRLIRRESGTVEGTVQAAFAVDGIEAAAGQSADKLAAQTLAAMQRRGRQTFVSIVDFRSLSPLRRTEWLQTALPRELQGAAAALPDTYVLERDDLDVLLTEARLRQGGLVGETKQAVPANRYLIVSGTVDERQPSAEPLRTYVTVRITDTLTDKQRKLTVSFPSTETAEGLRHARQAVADELRYAGPAAPDPAVLPPKAEIDALLEQVYGLMGERIPATLRERQQSAWESIAIDNFGAVFSDSGHVAEYSAARKARISRAMAALKRAVILDNADPYLKSLLSCLLVDRQAEDLPLARSLALEVAGQHPGTDYERDAWLFLLSHTKASVEEMERYMEQLTRAFPKSRQAQAGMRYYLNAIRERDESAPDERIDLARVQPIMTQAVAWGSDHTFVAGALQPWFYLTAYRRVTGKGLVPRGPASAAKGAEFVFALAKAYPERAVAIYTHWAWQFYDAKDWAETARWCREGLRQTKQADEDRYLSDYLRLMLGKSLLALGDPQDATAALKAVQHPYHLGQAKEALASIKATPAHARTVILREPEWLPAPELLAGFVSDIAWDGHFIWVALKNQAASRFANDHNLIMLEKDSAALAAARTVGGLARIDPATCKMRLFTPADGLSDAWVTCLAFAGGKLWVGTYHGGVDSYDPATGEWRNLSVRDGLPSNAIQCMDSDGRRLWVGAGRFKEGAVASIDLQDHTIRAYLPADYPQGDRPPVDYVTAIRCADGKVWCALNEQGVAMYDPATNRWHRYDQAFFHRQGDAAMRYFTDYLDAIAVSDGRVWFGSYSFANTPEEERGIANCNLQAEDWSILAAKDGLPEPCVYAFAEHNGALICGTDGIELRNPNGAFTGCALRQPNAPTFTVTVLRLINDELWIGTAYGLKSMRLPE